jgi:hypothetical protein
VGGVQAGPGHVGHRRRVEAAERQHGGGSAGRERAGERGGFAAFLRSGLPEGGETIFTASAASEGAVLGLGGLLPVASTVIVTTTARETSQPNTYAAPLRTPRLEGSTTRNAVSGSGSSATARPITTRLRITAQISSS